MNRSWFDDYDDYGDGDDDDDDEMRLGFPRRRSVLRWTSGSRVNSVTASVVQSQLSFLEEDMELQATSARLLREATSSSASATTSTFASRRRDLAHRFNDLIRNSADGSRYQSNDDEMNKNLQAIKEENMKLQAVITDVTEVNKRWQKYNNDRQMYVQRLLSTIQDQQEQMKTTIEKRAFLSSDLSKEKDFREDNIILLEKRQLEEEVIQQRNRLASLEKEYKEHVAVLEFQVKAHRDDWEAERSEKQQVLKDKIAVEAKVRQLQKDVRCLKLKLREERMENSIQCSCCGIHATESEQRSEAVTNQNPCSRNNVHSKTFRTSVHLPCTSGHLLPRGTTLCIGEDLATDSEEIPANTLTKRAPPDGVFISRSNSEEDPTNLIDRNPTDSKRDTDSAKYIRKRNVLSKSLNNSDSNVRMELPKPSTQVNDSTKVTQSASQPNLPSQSTSRLSCSVVHITPSQSSSSCLASDDVTTQIESTADSASGVTIGFSDNGLASVLSFTQTPIVKSFSLPTSRGKEDISKSFECKLPVSQPSSLGSSWAVIPIASPPTQTYATSAESLFQNKKYNKLSLLGEYAKSVKQLKESTGKLDEASTESVENASAQRATTWKSKYFEDGVATQTKEDLICPSCGQLFPPIIHIKFLDHYEKCQNTNLKEHNLSKMF